MERCEKILTRADNSDDFNDPGFLRKPDQNLLLSFNKRCYHKAKGNYWTPN